MSIISTTDFSKKKALSDTQGLSAPQLTHEQRFHEVMDGVSPSVFVGLLTVDGILTYINKSALEMFDKKLDELLGKPFTSLPPSAFSSASRKLIKKSIKLASKGEASRFDVFIRDKNDTVRIMDFFLNPVMESEGRVAYLVLSARDVTDRQKAEYTLQMNQFAVDHAEGAIFQVDAEGKVIYVNASACRYLGYTHEQLIGRAIHDIDLRLNASDWPATWLDLKAHGSLRGESVHRHYNGREIPVEYSFTYFEYHEEEYSFLYIKDISEVKANSARIEYFAHYDRITRLPNRMLFTTRLNQAINVAEKNGHSVAVFFIGIDRFKLINDIFGNLGGDEILQIAANRLAGVVGEMDTVARTGGDEFAIVIEKSNFTEWDVSDQAQKILDMFSTPFFIGGQELFVMSSIGVALYPKNGRDVDELLKNASAALHQAKSQGGHDYHLYTSAPESRDKVRWQIEIDLRHALERNEFHLYYQPRVDSNTGLIVGAEALLRWHHPVNGVILPEYFINIAEETGMIVKIGEWVLKTACEQQKSWVAEGAGFTRLGVNLSTRQFKQKDLVQKVSDIVAESGIHPHMLELELTESLLMLDVKSAIDTMKELKKLGVHLALDDFGTGYSSLSYLRYFPFDTLKIDRSFVSEITFDESSVAIAEAIIVMSHRLHLTVIAEGVETPAQLEVLRTLGCDQIQGFHFSKPLTVEEVTQLFRHKRY